LRRSGLESGILNLALRPQAALRNPADTKPVFVGKLEDQH
jgi:hypothetical protein